MSVILVLGVFSGIVSAKGDNTTDFGGLSEIFKNGRISEVTDSTITIECDRVINSGIGLFSLHNGTSHQKDICTIVLDGTKSPDEMISTLSTISSETDSYSGAAATLYSTINYEVSRANGMDYMRLVSASGRVVKFDSRTTVTQNNVTLGTTGLTANGKFIEVTQDYSFPNVYQWSATAPAKFLPVEISEMNTVTVVGCNYTCTLKRGTATIKYKLVNNAYEP